MQINKCNTPHKQNEGEKSHDQSIKAEIAFDEVQHTFMGKKKIPSKVGAEGSYQHN